jgi:hypothetical protein
MKGTMIIEFNRCAGSDGNYESSKNEAPKHQVLKV